ncbi:meiosis-specific coiled-coil domain-containing protein MEIOC [Triplophysa dalaica]|uniref:meiosis-specific coiled-coil domain-containing protein MEIOC n=1 Tax=Triplophysa dalaica TaxID=1582913 RepID=UPI0024DF5D89|nr:meiosis-specific coiled-coil domain-containing protein MEIOC [Triplophysa dalaica]
MEVNYARKSQVNGGTSGGRNNFVHFQNSGPDSYFHQYKLQKSYKDGKGLSPSFNSLSDSLLKDYPPVPDTVWPALEDNCKSMDYPRSMLNNRLPIDASNCGSEADLYGLVSNILDEPDSIDQYSYFSEKASSLKGVWSPKLLREDSLHYFHNDEVQMTSSSGFPSNQIYPKPIGRESHEWAKPQNINGFDSSTPFHFSSCNGEPDAYFSPPQNLPHPPGLTAPSALSSYITKPEYITPEKDEGYCSSNNCLSDYISAVNNSCHPPDKMDGSFFRSPHAFSAVSKEKVRKEDSFSVQDIGKQAFLLTEQDGGFRDSGQNGLLVQKNHEEIIAEQASRPYQRISEYISQMPDFKREITRSHVDQMRADVGGKNMFSQSYFPTNEFFGFGQQPPKVFLPTLNPNKEANQIASGTPQSSVNQFQHALSNHYQSQTRIPSKTSNNLESQGLAKLMSMSGVVPLPPSQQLFQSTARVPHNFNQGSGENLQCPINQGSLDALRNGVGNIEISDYDLLEKKSSAGSMVDGRFTQRFGMKSKLQAGFLKEADKKPGLQNPFQGVGNVYTGQVGHIRADSNAAKPTPSQLFPFLYQTGDPRKNAFYPMHSQPPLPYGPVPHADMNENLADGEISPLRPYLQEVSVPSQVLGDGSFPGFLFAMSLPKLGKELGSPNSQLHYYLEECYEQWRMLEKERKKAETVLIKSYPEKRVSVLTSSALPKMPPNPTRVDRLIVDQLREHGKVAALLGKMEQLRSFPLHANINSALDRHLEFIYTTQARRKDEFINASGRQRQPAAFFKEEREILLLASAVKDLCASTRKARTALWCALQMTLPKMSRYQEEKQEKGSCSPVGQDNPEQSSLERAIISL